MPKVIHEVLSRVREALELCKDEVDQAGLSFASQRTYTWHAENFIRWLNDDFTPGSRFQSRRHGMAT